MRLRASVLHDPADYLDAELLDDQGRMRLLPAEQFARIPHIHLQAFCVRTARYALPTVELIAFFRELISGQSALEICAGMGDIGRHVPMRMTDSAAQTLRSVRAHFEHIGQAPTVPPRDVERIDALSAVAKHRPRIVVGCWVTQLYRDGDKRAGIGSSSRGVDELALIRSVDVYVHVGHDGPHSDKRALALPHETLRPTWLFSRGFEPARNVIHIWRRQGRRAKTRSAVPGRVHRSSSNA